MTKMRNADVLAVITDVFQNVEGLDEDVKNAVLKYCETQTATIAKKAEREKIRNAEKPKKEDDVLPVVKSVMTAEFQDMPQIIDALEAIGHSLSRQKIAARISKLVASGEVEKKVTRSQNHVNTSYRLVA